MFQMAERLLLSSLLSWLRLRGSTHHMPAAKLQLSTLPGKAPTIPHQNDISLTKKVFRGVSKELQQRQISVNAIAPGPMNTREFQPIVFWK